MRYRSSVYGVAATVGHVPRMHLGKWSTCILCIPAVLQCAPSWGRAGKLITLRDLHAQCGKSPLHQLKSNDRCFAVFDC